MEKKIAAEQVVSVRIADGTKTRLEALADVRGTNVSAVIRDLIEAGISRVDMSLLLSRLEKKIDNAASQSAQAYFVAAQAVKMGLSKDDAGKALYQQIQEAAAEYGSQQKSVGQPQPIPAGAQGGNN